MLYNLKAMDNYSKAEINNRPKALAVIRSILKPEYEVVESPVEEKDHYDFLIRRKSDGKVVALVEHKDRCYTSTTFSDWLLSSKKKIFLDHYSLPTYYLNTFTDGVWAMWDTKNTSYTQRMVILVSLWPRIFATTSIDRPLLRRNVAAVCLPMWVCIGLVIPQRSAISLR